MNHARALLLLKLIMTQRSLTCYLCLLFFYDGNKVLSTETILRQSLEEIHEKDLDLLKSCTSVFFTWKCISNYLDRRPYGLLFLKRQFYISDPWKDLSLCMVDEAAMTQGSRGYYYFMSILIEVLSFECDATTGGHKCLLISSHPLKIPVNIIHELN